MLDLETLHGPARVHLRTVTEPRAALILGHGAGGGVAARDLVAATDAARAEGLTVALVEQPYRVAGRRSPAPARQLDAAWIAVVEQLAAEALSGLAPRGRRPVVGRARRLPNGCSDRLGGCALPRLPAPAATAVEPVAEPPPGAGRGAGPDARRAG